jgi:hypothetical protein
LEYELLISFSVELHPVATDGFLGTYLPSVLIVGVWLWATLAFRFLVWVDYLMRFYSGIESSQELSFFMGSQHGYAF